MYRMISVALLIVVILVTSLLFYKVMIGFFIPLFLAALMVVLFHPLHDWFKSKLRNRPKSSALLTTMCILLIVLIPAGILIGVASHQATSIMNFDLDKQQMTSKIRDVAVALKLDLPFAEDFETIDAQLLAVNGIENLETEGVGVEETLDSLEGSIEKLHKKLLNAGNPNARDFFDSVTSEVTQLKEILHTAKNSEPLAEESAEPPDPTDAFKIVTRTMVKEYAAAKTEIAGGVIWGPLRQRINPTRARIDAWYDDFIENDTLAFDSVKSFLGTATKTTAVYTAKTRFRNFHLHRFDILLLSRWPRDDKYDHGVVSIR